MKHAIVEAICGGCGVDDMVIKVVSALGLELEWDANAYLGCDEAEGCRVVPLRSLRPGTSLSLGNGHWYSLCHFGRMTRSHY